MQDKAAHFLADRKWLGRAVLFLLGAVTGLGHAPFDLWPATVLGFVAIFYVMGRGGPSHAWWIGFGYFALTLHWIVEPFLVDVARHGWMAPFALVLLSGGLALFWAGAGGIAQRIGATTPERMIGFGLALVCVEMARSTILTGFPWALPAYGLTASGLLPLASVWGPHGVGALLLGTCLGAALLTVQQWRSGGLWLGVSTICVAGTIWTLSDVEHVADAPIVRIVQPNAPQNEKWQQGKAREFLDRQLAFTRAGEAAELVIWPETSVAFSIYDVAPLASEAARGGTVIFGAQRFMEGRYFNSLVFTVNGAITHVYDKHHLVPFGEYFPLGNHLGRLGIRGLAENDGGGFAAGPRPKTLVVDGIGSVLPLICYESIFPHLTWLETQTNLIVVATNDAWFGQFAGPQQHLAQARWRAAEQGTPVARSANTGISAMIDARGRVVTSLGMGQAGYFDTPLPPKAPIGLYAKQSFAVQLCLFVLCLLGLFILWRANVRHFKN